MTIKFLGLGQSLTSGLTVEAPSTKIVKDLLDTKQDNLTFSTGLTNSSNTITLNIASPTSLGGVIIPASSNLNLDSSGNLTVNLSSTSQKGLIEIATDTEFSAGSATDLAITPKQSSSVAQTLTNKTLDANSNTIMNLAVSNFIADAIATTITSNPDQASNTKLATEKAIATFASDLIKLTDISATSPISYNNITGVISGIFDSDPMSGSNNFISSGAVYAAIQSALSGALVYQGQWDATGQTDYSSIPVPAKQGYMYIVTGDSTTIDGKTWYSGDFLIINKNVSTGTVTSSDVDQVDNTESLDLVRLDTVQTLTNKTLDANSNTITNLTTGNFASGIIRTNIRNESTATDTNLVTEKAVATSLISKQDNLTFSTGLTNSSNTITVTYPVANPSGNSGKFLSNDGTNTVWQEIQGETYTGGYGISVNEDTKTITNTAPNIQSNWNATTPETGQILNKPNLATVATSGSYNDLSNVPTFSTGLTNSSNTITVTYPLPGNFPSMSGNSGKFLSNDGTNIIWDVPENTTYTFGTGLSIDSNNNVTLDIAGTTLGGVKSGGANITIASDGTISATDTTYSAGIGIGISDNVITNTSPNIQSNWTATTVATGQILNKPTFSTGLTYQNNTVTVTYPVATPTGNENLILSNDGTNIIWDNLIKEIGSVSDTAPSNPSLDDTYYDTGLNQILTWNGSAWVDPVTPVNDRIYRSDSDNVLYVYLDNRLKPIGSTEAKTSLAELNDVSLTNLETDQIIKYNSTTQKWENKDQIVATIRYW